MRQEKRIPRHPQKRKSPFPAETAEKRRFGAVPLLLISQGAYTKMEIKKALSYGQGRNRAVPPCIILHIPNADRRRTYCTSVRSSQGTRFPSIPVSILPALCHFRPSSILFLAFVYLSDIIIGPFPPVKEIVGQRAHPAPQAA